MSRRALGFCFAVGALAGCADAPAIAWDYPGAEDDGRVRGLVVRAGSCAEVGGAVLYDERFRPGEGPPIGRLGEPPFAFEARVYGERCEVVAAGCTDVADYRDVRLVLELREGTEACLGRCVEGFCDQADVDAVPDADGDGFRAPADCDDADPRRNPLAPELCDTAELDEDCDGTRNEGCACAVGEPPRTCGTNALGRCALGEQLCVEGRRSACTAAARPVAELCNGEDDDCDGRTDEGFECVLGSVEEAPTACGNGGRRRCVAGCVWSAPSLDEETAATCDYCDDVGEGLSAERALATERVATTHPIQSYGDAIEERLVDGRRDIAKSSLLYAETRLGYGVARFRARVRITPTEVGELPRAGWGLAVWDADVGLENVPARVTPGVGDGLGPIDRRGLSAEWWLGSTRAGDEDQLMVRQLDPDGPNLGLPTSPVRIHQVDPALAFQREQDGNLDQELVVELTPDDPETEADETELALFLPGAGEPPLDVWRCCDREDDACRLPCRVSLPSGLPVVFAVLGAGTTTQIEWVDGRLELDGVCPGEGMP